MPSIDFEVRSAVAYISLNRPEKFNAFNREMSKLFQQILDECVENPAIRALYITGKGKAFSAGQDLAEIPSGDAAAFRKILTEQYNPIVTRIRNIPKPVVCAVNGVAAGAGANIALCCDIVVAAHTASFVQAFSKIGLIPDSGGTYTLPRLIGFQRASALMMLGDKISAADAERMGMIYKVFTDEKFFEESIKLATTLSEMPTAGLAFTKRALNESFSNSLEQQLETEDRLQSFAAATNDFKEGVQAFLEKRKPVFLGN